MKVKVGDRKGMRKEPRRKKLLTTCANCKVILAMRERLSDEGTRRRSEEKRCEGEFMGEGGIAEQLST